MGDDGRAEKRRRRIGYGRLAIAALVAFYMGAYYATYTMPRGMKWGTVPHYQYRIGSAVLPASEAYYLFYPAHWLDRQIRPRQVDE
jgi:hypothetical protein